VSELYTERTVEWARQLSHCWVCGSECAWGYGGQIHHVPGGCRRQKNNLATTFYLCSGCHATEHHGDGLGMVWLLARKKRQDPEHYDLDAFLAAWRPKATEAFQNELEAAVGAETSRMEVPDGN